MKEEEATFLIRIKFQKNSTWQGTICWVEANKRQNFRSMLEMIKLIDDILLKNKVTGD